MDFKKAAEITARYNKVLRELMEDYREEMKDIVPEMHPVCVNDLRVQYTVKEVSEGFEHDFTSPESESEFWHSYIDGVEFVEVIHTDDAEDL